MTFTGEDVTFEIKVIKISKGKKEQLDHVKFREPYPDERNIPRDQLEKDPQYGYKRVMRDVDISEDVFFQRVKELDIAALVAVVNDIKK